MGIVHELLTGQAASEADPSLAEANGFDSWEDEDDDFFFTDEDPDNRLGTPGNSANTLTDFDDEEDDWELEQQREREDRARRAEAEREEEQRRAEEQRIAEQDAARREDNRRREEEQRAEQARRDAEIDDSDDFQFGTVDPDDIGIENFEFGSAVSDITVEDDYSSFDDNDDWETQALSYDDELDALDGSEPQREERRQSTRETSRESSRTMDSGSRSSRARTSTTYTPKNSDLSISINVGMSKYQTLSFLTSGLEASFALSNNLTFDAGIEAQSTERKPFKIIGRKATIKPRRC
jgi:hypothetical protein